MVARWSEEAALTIVGEAFFPEYRITVLQAADLKDCEEPVFEDLDRISLQEASVDVRVMSAAEYLSKNPNGLVINVGDYRDGLLYESFLGAMNDDVESMKLWERVRNRTKRSMSKGAWIVNDGTGARARLSGHSYTTAAKELQDAGVVMVAYSAQMRYELD
jgi:hypothetical protein